MAIEVSAVDHVYVSVGDLERSEHFYDRLMAVLDFRKVARPLAGGDLHVHYFNRDRSVQLSLRPARAARAHDPYSPGLHHLCLRVADREAVDAVVAGLRRYGIRASDPRLYPEYYADYYATFLEDPDGIRLEVVSQLQAKLPVGTADWAVIAPIIPPHGRTR